MRRSTSTQQILCCTGLIGAGMMAGTVLLSASHAALPYTDCMGCHTQDERLITRTCQYQPQGSLGPSISVSPKCLASIRVRIITSCLSDASLLAARPRKGPPRSLDRSIPLAAAAAMAAARRASRRLYLAPPMSASPSPKTESRGGGRAYLRASRPKRGCDRRSYLLYYRAVNFINASLRKRNLLSGLANRLLRRRIRRRPRPVRGLLSIS